VKLVWGWLIYLSIGPFVGFWIASAIVPIPIPEGPYGWQGLFFLGCAVWAAACQGTVFILFPWLEWRKSRSARQVVG
jgi:hypothetical protein